MKITIEITKCNQCPDMVSGHDTGNACCNKAFKAQYGAYGKMLQYEQYWNVSIPSWCPRKPKCMCKNSIG